MKVIFSRKGFDSSAGGIPSPILPDGTLLPLPVPQADGPVRFSQLQVEGRSLSSMIKQLGGKGWRGRCHLDPDLDARLIERPDGWLPAFGQYGSAQRHLAQEGVGVGDLHVLHSWLQVGAVHEVNAALLSRFPGLAQHPHLAKHYPFNTLYMPTRTLSVEGRELAAGAGMFGAWRASLQLTQPGQLRSVWTLPGCFAPQASRSVLSYHRNPERWHTLDDGVQLSAVYRGQEFVVESAQPEQVVTWLTGIFSGPDSQGGRF